MLRWRRHRRGREDGDATAAVARRWGGSLLQAVGAAAPEAAVPGARAAPAGFPPRLSIELVEPLARHGFS